jgi:creatinine amidohydrolase
MERQVGHGVSFGHGAEPLLSLTMAARPDHVTSSQVSSTVEGSLLGLPMADFGAVEFDGIPINVPAEFDKVSDQVMRDAKTRASAELGDAVSNQLVNLIAKFIKHYVSVT